MDAAGYRLEENVSSISVANGIWSGRVTVTNPTAGSSGYVFPLFQGSPLLGRLATPAPTTRRYLALHPVVLPVYT